MSFLKFRGESDGNGRGQVFWSRAQRDGLPFRGEFPPLLRDEEFDEYAERVDDVKYGVFDTSKPEQLLPEGDPKARTYRNVLDGIVAGWFKMLCREHKWAESSDGQPVMYVYIEWTEPYMEVDTTRIQSLQGGIGK